MGSATETRRCSEESPRAPLALTDLGGDEKTEAGWSGCVEVAGEDREHHCHPLENRAAEETETPVNRTTCLVRDAGEARGAGAGEGREGFAEETPPCAGGSREDKFARPPGRGLPEQRPEVWAVGLVEGLQPD